MLTLSIIPYGPPRLRGMTVSRPAIFTGFGRSTLPRGVPIPRQFPISTQIRILKLISKLQPLEETCHRDLETPSITKLT